MTAGAARTHRIAIVCVGFALWGGAERLIFEEARALERAGYETAIATFEFSKGADFAGHYRPNVVVIRSSPTTSRFRKLISQITQLDRWIASWGPDLIIAISANEAALLWPISLLRRTPYLVHVNGTQFWFPPDLDLTKYALRYRSVFGQIMARSPAHAEFVPRRVRLSLRQRIRLELSAWWQRAAVRHARRRIAFTRRTAWEIGLIYGAPAVVLKGAFPAAALEYEPRRRPLEPYRRHGGPVIFNANRLDLRKRVELAIHAFAILRGTVPNATLVIAGEGYMRERLEALVRDLDLVDFVHFVGFVPEDELWDWLGTCDVFVHPNWAEFAIAPFEALALGTKVVWSDEMEMDEEVRATGLAYPAAPTADAMARALADALVGARGDRRTRSQLRSLTWESYFARLLAIVGSELGAVTDRVVAR